MTNGKMREYKRNIARVETIDELAWIKTDLCEERCGWDEFKALYDQIKAKREKLEKQGQRYRRARKPSWMK